MEEAAGGRPPVAQAIDSQFPRTHEFKEEARMGGNAVFLWAVLIQPCRPGGSVPAAKKKELINLVLQVVLKGIGKKMSDNLFPSRIVVNKKRLHKLKVSVQQIEG